MGTVAELKAVVENLSQKDQTFARSLVESVEKWDRISVKQQHWVDVLIQRAIQIAPKATEIGNMSNILSMFENARKKIKYPAVVLGLENGRTIRLAMAGEGSSQPGTITVTALERTGENGRRDWYGRVNRDGTYSPSKSVSFSNDITNILKKFATDPLKVASEQGRATGNCVFCSRSLTQEKSVEDGYGPVCAKRYVG
jgi:hypothetical protein